jgi:ribosomal subunit interface protein
MVVAYTVKGGHLTDAEKEYLEKRMQKFKFFFDQVLNIKVIAEKKNGLLELEIKVTANHETFIASDTKPTWEEVCDNVTDKIEKEIVRFKDKKVKDHRHPHKKEAAE